MIPRIVHFIWINSPHGRSFNVINMLAVKMAHEIIKPGLIFMHCCGQPEANPYWDEIRQYVIIRPFNVATEYEGMRLEYIQYQSDLKRLQVLKEEGGVYLDTDMLMIRPIDDLYKSKCMMGVQNTYPDGKVESLCAALIMAEPESDFINEWLKRFGDGLRTGIWSHHCVVVPAEIMHDHPDWITVPDRMRFMPWGLQENYLFLEPPVELPDETCAIHVWETYWRGHLNHVTPDYIKTGNNLFCKLFSPYVEV